MSQDPDVPHSYSPHSDNQGSNTIGEKRARVLGFREDWAVISLGVFVFVGFVVSIIDFVYFQMRIFQLVWVIVGLPLLVFDTALLILALWRLFNVGVWSVLMIKRLQIVEGHRLVTDGYYRYIRHPSYLGVIGFMFGLAITLSSLYGLGFMAVGVVFLLVRIGVEEGMLVGAFGEESREYQRKTRKLVPFLY